MSLYNKVFSISMVLVLRFDGSSGATQLVECQASNRKGAKP